MYLASDGNMLTIHTLYAALSDAGIVENDIIFVHSSIKPFGKPITNGVEIAIDWLAALNTVIGNNGTMIMPMFNFDFYHGKEFNTKATRGRMGSLPNVLWKVPSSLRSKHPSFSVVANGLLAESYTQVSMKAFGRGSVFEKLSNANGKIVCIGVHFRDCATFVHYVEEMHGVPYRYHKQFTGIADGKEVTCEQYVRMLDGTAITEWYDLECHLLKTGMMKQVNIGDSFVQSVSCDDVYNTVWKILDENPIALVRQA